MAGLGPGGPFGVDVVAGGIRIQFLDRGGWLVRGWWLLVVGGVCGWSARWLLSHSLVLFVHGGLWLEDEERVDAPNQKLEDLWSIPLPLERGELRFQEWNRYIRKYRRSLKLVEDWNEASEIRHLLKDVLPGHWKRRVEDEEKKRAKKRVAVQIMASEDTHAGIMEFFRQNLREPSRMLGLKNAVWVEVFSDTMGQRLMRLNNVEWRRGEPLRTQVIFARMSLDEIVRYITVELKLNAKNEAHVQD